MSSRMSGDLRKAKQLQKQTMDLENSMIEERMQRDFFDEDDLVTDGSFEDLEETDDVEFRDESSDKKIKKFAQNFHNDVQSLAKHYTYQFFSDKTMFCGGKIPKKVLDKRISMVINYNISTGVLQAYDAMSELIKDESFRNMSETSSDIKLVNETLNLLARSGVPQQFAGGMLLLYLEFVEGVEVGS